MKNKLINIAILIIASLSSVSALATCVTNTGAVSAQRVVMSPPNITVQRDAAVGTTLATYMTSGTGLAIECDAGSRAFLEMSLFRTPSSQSGYYNTNIPGVAVMMNYSGPNNLRYDSPPFTYVETDPIVDMYFVPAKVTFIKTGNITSGTLNSGLFSRVYGDGGGANAVEYYLNSLTVTQLACSITTSTNLTFPIGDISASSFGSTVGYSPPAAQATKTLGLTCNPGANVNVSLSGQQNPDVGTTSVLALTGQGGAGVASGVGVQILYNQTPLILNNRISLRQSASAQESFPLVARYYQTKTTVTTGSANASATLNLTYQ